MIKIKTRTKKETENRWAYSRREIEDLFEGMGGGCRSFSREQGEVLFRALSALPKEIAEWAIGKLVFVSSLSEYSAYTLNIEELAGRGKVGFVVLCENLKRMSTEDQTQTIAHEIAHCWLKHPTTYDDEKILIERGKIDEEQADDLARIWLTGKPSDAG